MADYQKMYTTLFNAITDAIVILQKSQQETEEAYISANQENFTVVENPDAGSNIDGTPLTPN